MVGILAGVGGVDISYEDIARMVEHIYGMVEERGRVYIPAYWYHLGKFHPMPPHESVFLAPEQAPKGE